MIKIYKDGKNSREEIFSVVEPKVDVSAVVSEIIENVKTNGDKALYGGSFFANTFSHQKRITAGGLGQTGQHFDGSGLSRAVDTQQGKQFTLPDL